MEVKARVRFPNESYSIPINIDTEKFELDKEFDDEVFGWYGDDYIAINRQDHLKF